MCVCGGGTGGQCRSLTLPGEHHSPPWLAGGYSKEGMMNFAQVGKMATYPVRKSESLVVRVELPFTGVIKPGVGLSTGP